MESREHGAQAITDTDIEQLKDAIKRAWLNGTISTAELAAAAAIIEGDE